jgi:NADH dehydrogenase
MRSAAATAARRPRIVVVGGGFAGHQAARTLSRRLGQGAQVVVVNPTGHSLYLPLLPEVAAGTLEPRRIAVSLAATLPGVRLVLGKVDTVDVRERRVTWVDPEGGRGGTDFDRLVLAAGSATRLLPVPGIAQHAHGFQGIPEALYLRDHVTRQIELAAVTEDAAERAARCTFIVVGGGYTGTEVAAQGALLTAALAREHRPLRGQRMRWMLLDSSPRIQHQLDGRLSRTAHRVLRGAGCRGARRGVGDGGLRRWGSADNRRANRHPHPGVVRRCAARSAGRRTRPARPVGGGPVPRRSRLSGRRRVRRRRRRTRPDLT